MSFDRKRVHRFNQGLTALLTCLVGAVVIGCGGGGGGGGGGTTSATTTATTAGSTTSTSATTTTGTIGGTTGTTSPGVLPSNVIVYGDAGTFGNATYSIKSIPPTGGAASVIVSGIPATIQLFALNPVVANQWVYASGASGPVGIYSNTTYTTNGSTQIVAPVYSALTSLSITQDGKYIVYTAFDVNQNSNLYVVPIGGGSPVIYDTSYGSCVSTSNPDIVLFSKIPSTGIADQVYYRSIAAGPNGAATQLTTSANIDKIVTSISRDGTKFAYNGNNISNPGSTPSFYVETLSNGAVVQLPSTQGINLESAAFSADGNSLAILETDGSALSYLATQAISASASQNILISKSQTLETGTGVYWTSSNGRSVSNNGGGLFNALVRRRNATK